MALDFWSVDPGWRPPLHHGELEDYRSHKIITKIDVRLYTDFNNIYRYKKMSADLEVFPHLARSISYIYVSATLKSGCCKEHLND